MTGPDIALRPLAAGDESELLRIHRAPEAGFRPVGVMRGYERDVGGDGWRDGLLMELLAAT